MIVQITSVEREELKRIPWAGAASQQTAEGRRENILLVHNTSDLSRQNQLYLSDSPCQADMEMTI